MNKWTQCIELFFYRYWWIFSTWIIIHLPKHGNIAEQSNKEFKRYNMKGINWKGMQRLESVPIRPMQLIEINIVSLQSSQAEKSHIISFITAIHIFHPWFQYTIVSKIRIDSFYILVLQCLMNVWNSDRNIID